MSEKSNSPRHSLSQRLFLFLGSMDLAITLLLALAVASIIGTVLQQNQPYTDYVIKFGPFWFEVFEAAGLYDVYSALWFLAILCLLVLSTSVCVIRNTPSMLKDMFNLRTQVQEKSLRAMHHSQQWDTENNLKDSVAYVEATLDAQGFRVKQTPKDGGAVLISAMRGGMNRLGYIFTHLAIIIICLGGLLDSNLFLKFAEWQGKISIETRDIPTSEIPNESRLAVGYQAFRGSINIPEGRSAQVAFLAMKDGYLLQELPFRVEVKDFRIEHYATGQPKSFESDLVVYDDDLEKPLEQMIAVNHPLLYKGYAIYQASFSDGGTGLNLEAWPLDKQAGNETVSFDTRVFDSRKMHWGDETVQLEMTAFRPFNINPDPTDDDPERLRNFGPSFGFKIRSNTGEAKEYLNYMLPVPRNGRDFYLSGVRNSPAEEFGYLYLPLDADGELVGFQRFLSTLHDSEKIEQVAQTMMLETLESLDGKRDETLEQSLKQTLNSLVKMFMRGGFVEVSDFIETNIPETEKETLGPAYLSMLREMLARLYFMQASDVPSTEQEADAQLVFLQDAVDAIGSLSRYGSPVYLELTDYDHVEASGLQIARSPGKPIVYLGCALLIVGVFVLFYLPQRRLWIRVNEINGRVNLLLAGMSNRNPREFDQYFEKITQHLKLASGNSSK